MHIDKIRKSLVLLLNWGPGRLSISTVLKTTTERDSYLVQYTYNTRDDRTKKYLYYMKHILFLKKVKVVKRLNIKFAP